MNILEKPAALICDMDGTLADCEHRRHLIQQKKWNEFYSLCHEDKIFDHIGVIINRLYPIYKVIIVTGRPEKYKEKTLDWLERHRINFNDFYCRANGDYRKDYIVKEEILDNYIFPNYSPMFALDDRNQVVQMWRRRGIPCLQVAEGDF